MDGIQPNRPIPPTKDTKADAAAPSAQSFAKFNEAFSAPQIGGAFPTILLSTKGNRQMMSL